MSTGLQRTFAASRGIVLGAWHLPRKPGPAKKARKLIEYRYDDDRAWVVYEVLDNNGYPERRHCNVDIWRRWAGEAVDEPPIASGREHEATLMRNIIAAAASETDTDPSRWDAGADEAETVEAP
jgi:hypothetical protein